MSVTEQKGGHLIIPSSPNDRQKLKMMIEEITHNMAQAEALRDQKKDIINEIHEQFDIPKKTIGKVASSMYKHNYHDVQAENEDFELLYETLVGGSESFETNSQDAVTEIVHAIRSLGDE